MVVTGDLGEGELTPARLLTIALAFGFAVAVVVAAMGRLSGAHINPAVTVAVLITGHVSPMRGLLYIEGQLGGAAIGALLIVAVVPGDGGSLGATSLGADVSSGAGLLAESILTFALVFVIFGTAVDPKGPTSLAPIAIGLTVAVDIMIGGPLTGGSMNPARSFGSALVAVEWADHWLYWVGPLIGGVLAALVYHRVYLRKEG